MTRADRSLVLEFADASYVIRAEDVSVVDGDGGKARVAVRDTLDLGALLGATVDEGGHVVRLVVHDGRQRVAFRAAANLDFTSPAELYRLPRVLAALGCRPWVRGLALLPDDKRETPRVAIWIDLVQLARDLNRESEAR